MSETFSLFWDLLFISHLRVPTANLIGKRLYIGECPPHMKLVHLLCELYVISFDTTIFPNIVSTIHQMEL